MSGAELAGNFPGREPEEPVQGPPYLEVVEPLTRASVDGGSTLRALGLNTLANIIEGAKNNPSE